MTFVVATLGGKDARPCAGTHVGAAENADFPPTIALLKTVVSEGQNFSVILEKRFWAAALKANSDAGFARKTEKIGM